MGITYADLNGIKEVVPNKEYKIRLTTGNRERKTIYGTLLNVISEKNKLEKEVETEMFNKTKRIKKYVSNITFQEAAELTINYLVELAKTSESIDLNTVYDYERRLNTYVYGFFPKNSKLSSINESKVKEFINYMFNRKKENGDGFISISSVEKAYSVLSWIIRYCSEITDPVLLPENYTNNVRFKALVPKGRGRKPFDKRNKSCSPERLKRLSNIINEHANIRLKTMCNIILDVGCRNEECLGLKWNNINFETKSIIYDEAVTAKISKKQNVEFSGIRVKQLKSKHSYRKNYISDYTINCLKNLKLFKEKLGLSINDNDYVFTIWEDNKILSPISFADEFKTFRIKYGFGDVTTYDIRHSVTNILLESGIAPKDVAQYMGNSARTVLESYADIREETQEKMQVIINDKLRGNHHREFSIDAICVILNSNDIIDSNDNEAMDLLDFVINGSVSVDDEGWAIDNAKSLILEQYPILEMFLDDNPDIIKAKIDTYKTFNKCHIELTQNELYFKSNIKI